MVVKNMSQVLDLIVVAERKLRAAPCEREELLELVNEISDNVDIARKHFDEHLSSIWVNELRVQRRCVLGVEKDAVKELTDVVDELKREVSESGKK